MLEPGEHIDIWVVETALGSGGMGSVYRCHNRTASRIMAAIKVLESGLRRHPEAEARFIREAEILFQLDHPNIVKVRNIRTDSDPPYLEMEFVEGESLEERLRRGALPFDAALTLMEQCASALAYLHDKGVRHRDIKPANLLVKSDGRIKLVDFGLAMEAGTSRITQQGMAFGTVSYAPPEWIAPDTLDPARWDIYALGVVFYEMLTGKVAFPVSGQGSARQQAMQVIVGKQHHEPLDPGSDFHDDLRAIVRDMTMADAARRIATSEAVLHRVEELTRALRRQPGVTLAPSLMEEADDETSLVSEPPELPPAPVPAEGPNTWSGIKATPVPTSRGTPLPSPQRGPVVEDRSRRRAGGLLALASVGAVSVGGVVLVAAIAVGLWVSMGAADTRGLHLDVQPVPATDLSVTLGGVAPDVDADAVKRFDAAPVGENQVDWAIGAGCEAPCSDCAPWCRSGSEVYTVEPGSGLQRVQLELPEVPLHTITVSLTEVPLDLEVTAQLGDLQGTRSPEGELTFTQVMPGPYTLTLTAGDCPEAAAACWPDGDCPAGCSALRSEVVVPWEGLDPWPVALPPPAEAEAPAPAPAIARVRPQPQPEQPKPVPAVPAPDAPRAGPQIRVGQLAAWLETHPKFQPGGDNASPSPYLKGWAGATPPEGADPDAPVTLVSFLLADNYCKSRNQRLPTLDTEPRTFVPRSNVVQELRVGEEGTPLALSDDGTTAPLRNEQVGTFMSFRCAP